MSSIDLTTPTRQSARGLILIFLFSLQKFVRAFWPVLLVLVFQNEILKNKLVIVIAAILFVVLLIVHTILYYLNFYFYIADNEFILKKGYLRKQTLSVPLDRIQSVNTKQNLIQQLLDVVTLEIDTAGTVAKELKIHALENSYSRALQEKLQPVKRSVESTDAPEYETPEDKEEKLLHLTPADLLRIGISQNHIRAGLIILAFGFQIFNQVQDVFQEQAEKYSNEFIEFMSQSNWALITFLILFFLLVSILFSLLRTILKYFDFKLLKRAETYRIESGLFNKRNVIIPHQKVQELNWETSPLKEIFGIYHLVFKQAVSGQNRRQQQQLVDAPGCLLHHLEKLKYDLFGEDKLAEVPRIYSNNFYFRRLWLLFGWLPVLLAAPFFYAEWMYWVGAPVWLLASAGYCYLIIKKRYFRVNNNQIRISKGAISHKWEQMELHKIQAVEFKQSIFQKRRSLASLDLMNASGTITLPFIDEKVAKQMYNYLLYHTEISKESWM
jgi:putative membrane protein